MVRPRMCTVCGDQFEVAHSQCEGCINVAAGLCRVCGEDLMDGEEDTCGLCLAEEHADNLFHAAHEEGRI